MFTPRPLLRSLPRGRIAAPLRALTTAPRRPPSTYTPASHHRATHAAHKRRQTTLIACATLSMATLWFLATSIDAQAETPPTAATITPGTPLVLHTAAERAAGVELVPSGTTSVPPFPKTLRLHGTEYALVGLGVRTVSFLRVEVYVVGLYVAADDLAAVQAALARRVGAGVTTAATGSEREALSRQLLDGAGGEAFWEELLGAAGVRSVLRIVPTRNTDYQHLRDGWVRGIRARMAQQPDGDDEAFAHALTAFKQAFGQKRAVPKQKTLLLARSGAGALECLFDPTGRSDGRVGSEAEPAVVLGAVADRRLSTALWMCYVAGASVASEGARRSIIEGLMALAERPIGTVGSTMA